MANELPGDDPKIVWQNQLTQVSTMTLTLIRSKARELQTKTRRKLAGLLVGPLAVAFFYAFGIREFSSRGYLLHPLFASALIWSLAGLYFLNLKMRSAEFPEDAGLSTGLAFCREEVERRGNLLRRVLLWSLGPILLALATFILGLATIGNRGRGLFTNGLPFLVLVVAWIFSYLIIRQRELRELKHEIEELNHLERDSRR
jgi:hypothetical protein